MALGCAVLALAACATSSSASTSGASKALAPLVNFPADQAAHTKVQNEWWYVVGHLHAGSRSFGYETTIFKFVNVQPPGFLTPLSAYRSDIAITDETRHGFFWHISYYFPVSASVSTTELATRVTDAALSSVSGRQIHLTASLKDRALSLDLQSQRNPMYVGGRGYIPFGNGYSYYYSLTDLKTTGTIRLFAKTLPVSGVSWMDHQWGTWSWNAIHGWTWMALQLSNGVQMSVFDFRSASGRLKAASVLTVGGKTRTLRNVTIRSTGSWKSSHTGATYPSGWVVKIPTLKARFVVTPSIRDQELIVPGDVRGSYWEGSGHLQGSYKGKPVTGQSYTELTGYAGS